MSGRFITFEGGEGAGKTTQIKRLHGYLVSLGLEVVCTREPGGTPNAEKIRELVVSGNKERWSAMEELLLMYASRAEHVRTLIQPSIKEGVWVICDRFADSSFVYQGIAGGVPTGQIKRLHKLVLGEFTPDITFVMDIPVETSQARVHKRAEALTRFEDQQTKFHEAVRNGFLKIAKSDDKRCHLIDANSSIEDIEAQIHSLLEPLITQKN